MVVRVHVKFYRPTGVMYRGISIGVKTVSHADKINPIVVGIAGYLKFRRDALHSRFQKWKRAEPSTLACSLPYILLPVELTTLSLLTHLDPM